ncbi:hypothetical protein RIF29_26342 [Crotalaria pallida]|uniref:Uncharacterized protein n=1 Tax=Crotalaria pallida TaxID=3830 RepID=A0AAN9EN77_CROPI
MGSFTPVNKSISIDLNDLMQDTQDTDKCQHFSLRGYVSNMREMDWKKCWPFPTESEERLSFPPLKVPQFRWWNCESCPKETATHGTNDQNHQTTSFNLDDVVNISDIQQVPMPDNIVAARDIDLNIPVAMGNTDKFTHLVHKKPRKISLVTDILRENQDPRMDLGQGSTSHLHFNMSTNSQEKSILPDKVDFQEDGTLTKRGRGSKRKFLPDENSKESVDMLFHRIENRVQNIENDERTIEIVPDNRSEDAPMGTSLKDGMKCHQHKPEHDRSHTMYKNDIGEKEGAFETPSGFFPHASTGKRMDNFSKGKGKMLQTDVELSILNTNMPTSLLLPSAQVAAPNGKGFEERLYLSSNLYSSVEACSKKDTNQSKNWLTFSLPEGSSKRQLIRKDNEPNSLRAIGHITNSLSGKRKGVYLEETNGTRNQAKNVSFYDLTTDEPQQDTHNDIPTEVVELMARTQIKRSMPDAENKSSSLQDMSTQMGKHLASVNRTTHGFIRRELNVYPRNGNATNSFNPYGGYQLGLNSNLGKTQSPFRFEVLKSKSKSSSDVYYSPVDTSKFSPAGTSNFKRSMVERGLTDAALQAWGGSDLQKNIMQQEHDASRPRPTLTRSYPSFRFAASQPTSSNNMDIITSLQSGSMHAIPTMNLRGLMDSSRRPSTTSFNDVVRAQLLQRDNKIGGARPQGNQASAICHWILFLNFASGNE